MNGSYEGFRSTVGVRSCALGPYGQRALLEMAAACGAVSSGGTAEIGEAVDLRWLLVQNCLDMVVMQQAVACRTGKGTR